MDSQTANLIAAGEVVERPAGVVKELVENAVDAGATRIEIALEEGGLKKITVSDNGCGMDASDAQACFGRHATSKIHSAKDLWSIHTLGFRGEALPSIASVSKVTLLTSDGKDATKVVIAYGKPQSVSPCPCPEGTEISVEGLFYQTPARLKHMRSASYEGSLIQNLVNKFAMSHPEIAFHLINDGRDSFRTGGRGDLLEVIYTVYGQSAAADAVKVHFEDFDYTVDGYLMKPSFTRASRSGMQIDLNGRMVRTYKLYKAVQDGYHDFIPQGRYPVCILSVQMDPHLLDVNVHPSKWEVRLSKENQLESLLRDKVAETFSDGGALKHAANETMPKTYYRPLSFEAEDLKPVQEEKKQEEKPSFVMNDDMRQAILAESKAENERMHEMESHLEEKEESYEAPFPSLRIIGQYHDVYIVCESENGLVLIDQHAASERILLEKIRNQLSNQSATVPLLLPLTIHAGSDVVNRIDELNRACASMHIVFEAFGSDTLIVRQIPSWMKDIDEDAFLRDLIDAFHQEENNHQVLFDAQKIGTMAARRAGKKVRHMTSEEMTAMIKSLSVCHNPYQDAHGNQTMIILDDHDLKKEFRK